MMVCQAEWWEAGVVGDTRDWGGGGGRLSINKSSSESIKAGRSLTSMYTFLYVCLP